MRELALGNQRAAKALDRHIGQHKQFGEGNAEVVRQMFTVIGFERPLRGRQHGALRVVDET